jgi:dTMP kinase
MEAEEAERRGGYGAEKYEKKEMQLRVREGYQELLATEFGKRCITRVDAGRGVEEVGDSIWEIAKGVLHTVHSGDLGEVGILGDW